LLKVLKGYAFTLRQHRNLQSSVITLVDTGPGIQVPRQPYGGPTKATG